MPESRSRTGCVQILEKVESSEETLCEKEGGRVERTWADGISCDIEEVKFYARPSHPVSSSVGLLLPILKFSREANSLSSRAPEFPAVE